MYSRVLILILMMLTIPLTANAAEPINNFEVEVLPAEGQQDFSEGYFNVDSKPGHTLSLNFRVTNNGEEAIRLSAQAVDAHTADGGGILYSIIPDAADEDQMLLSDLLEVQDTVTVSPGGAEKVHVHIAIPKSASGTLLGGVMLTTENASEDLSTEQEGRSNYGFERLGQRLVAVKVNLPEKSASGFSLGKAKFNADKNLLTMKVSNGKSAVLEKVQGTYTILDKEGEKLVSGVVEPFAMAPMSSIKFPIDLKGQLLEKGKYVLMIKGRADEKEFFAEEKFSVADTEHDAIAGETGESPPAAATSRENISRTIAIALVVLFLLLPLFLKLDRRNEKDPILNLSDKSNM